MNRAVPVPDNLLPHRGSMRLVDEILAVDARQAVTRSAITDRWPLFKDAAVSSLVCIELVAQTAGISNCWDGVQKQGEQFSNRGWLVGIKEAVFHLDTLPLSAPIITRSRNSFTYEGYREIVGTVEIGSEIVAEVQLQLIQSE